MMGLLQGSMSTDRENIREMQSSHAASAVSAVFDEPNLIAQAGLVPVMRLAERCGLSQLVSRDAVRGT
jgi:hypothetical protein